MPLYEYQCKTCGNTFQKLVSMHKALKPQECSCGSMETERLVSAPNFVLKGDSWPGKNLRIRKQMERKNKVLDRKQNEKKRMLPTLAPNVDGERVESWTEAKKLAQSKGKETTSYDAHIRKEKNR